MDHQFGVKIRILVEGGKLEILENSYPCEKCGKRFSNSSYLSDHLDLECARASDLGRSIEEINSIETAGNSNVRVSIDEQSGSNLGDEFSIIENDDVQSVITVSSSSPIDAPKPIIRAKHAGNSNIFFDCTFCGKQFEYECYLRRHLLTHNPSLTYYTCDLCGRRFRSQVQCIKHKAEHTGSQLHECPKCEKTFAYRSHLERHFRTHVSSSNIDCPHCSRRFSIPADLERHIRADHHGEPVQSICSYCDRRFAYPSYLKRHLAMHDGRKEHACGSCERAFATRSRLLDHVRRHTTVDKYNAEGGTGEDSFECDACYSTFKYEGALERHRVKRHC